MKKDIEICIWKLTTENNKKILGGNLYNNLECEKCDGYKTDCKDYTPKPKWYGKD